MRDRRMSVVGPFGSTAVPTRANGRDTITYSSPRSDTGVTPRAVVSASRPARVSRGSDDASTWPPAANAISVPVTALNCTARRSSRKNPTVRRPITLVDHLQEPAFVGHRGGALLGASGGGPHQRVGLDARARQHRTAGAENDQRVGVDLMPVFVRQRLHGGRVFGRHCANQFWQIGDETRKRREGLGEGRAALIDQRAGLGQVAPQLGFDFAGHLGVHEREDEAERYRGQQRAGHEDPVRKR